MRHCRQFGAEPSFIMPLLGVMASLFGVRSKENEEKKENKHEVKQKKRSPFFAHFKSL
jgi:hypothetical protein